ncbi:MAG: YbbR-like domain-containing protein [Planctomycetes bacterium]|nr:YbbR-like domain-containing protein [Planctomycetota bacterium]
MREFLFGNLKTRALALILAAFTWVSVWRESTDVFPATPVIDIRRPTNVLVLGIEDESGREISNVEVKMSGPRGQKSDLRSLSLSFPVKPGPDGKIPPEVTFDVNEDVLQLPAKFRLVEAKPRRIRVRLDVLDRQRMRLVPAQPAPAGQDPQLAWVDGKLAEGFYVKSVKKSADYVDVTGPRSVVQNHQRIEIKPIRIEGLAAGVHQFSAEFGRLDGQAVAISTQVTVTIEIAEEPQEQEFPVRISLLQTEEYTRDFTAVPAEKEAVVRVRGPRSAIDELKARRELLVVVIDIAGMGPQECQPVDDKPLFAMCPLVPQLRAKFAGSEEIELSVKAPEKAVTEVTFQRRAK